jgi:TolB-like protein/DNA-binding winged helix-turn-helix (wHTH) protein/Tfp pilus assembly protein PilF
LASVRTGLTERRRKQITVRAPESPQRGPQILSTPFSSPKKADSPPRFYRFDRFSLDVQRRLLMADGEPIAIKPKALETLLVLLECRNRVVEKDELMSRVWPETAVEEANLTQNIFVIRKALGEVPGQQRFIATVARRGYRFVADVTEHSDEPPAAAPIAGNRAGGRRPLAFGVVGLLTLVVTFAAAVAWNSRATSGAPAALDDVAVLPFRSLSTDTDQEYFADGMTDAVITDLSAISALRVVSRQSTMRYKSSTKPLPQIARELGVDAVIEGTVVRSGPRIRVTARLVNAAGDRQLWSVSYHRELGDVLALQGEMARAVADAVHATVTADERAALARRRPVDADAYDLYLRGRHFWEQRTETAHEKAIDCYQRAIQRDPTFAPAWAGIALANVSAGHLGYVPGSVAGPRVKAAAQRALMLDPMLVEAQVALAAHTVVFEWDWESGERAWKRILDRHPNQPVARSWYGFLLERLGRWQESLAQRERAVQADPLSPHVNAGLAEILVRLGRHDEAIDRYRRILDLDASLPMRVGLGMAHFSRGNYQAAILEIENVVRQRGDSRSQAMLAHVHAAAKHRREAQEILHRLEERARRGYVPPLYFAQVYAGLGDRDAAFAKLEAAYQERSANVVSVTADPLLAPLHSDARFGRFVRRMNLPWPVPVPSRASEPSLTQR